MQSDPNEELRLARRIAAGDENAVEEYYDRYAEPLYAFIYHHVNKEDAEEIWQDSLLVSIRGMAGYHGQSKIYTWLCAIARHKIADFFRRNHRLAENVSTPLEETKNIFDKSPLPEDWLQKKAVRVQVIDALQMLSEEYREALIARYADDKEVEVIARQLGRSYKATESLLSRARLAFQNAFTNGQGVADDQ
jgi:RNA polymerase sigma-70 factor (ECF subfamily)